jgi:hypothetical protein
MSERSATLDQVMPIFNSALQTVSTLVAGFSQGKADDQLARAVEISTAHRVADQKRENRIARSLARSASVQNTGQANLDILMQVSADGERMKQRLIEQGAITASYYRNVASQDRYAAGGQALALLGAGAAESYARGFLSKKDGTHIPMTTTLPATGGPLAIDPLKVA